MIGGLILMAAIGNAKDAEAMVEAIDVWCSDGGDVHGGSVW